MAQFVGDVFGLNTVYEKQLENIANGNFASWPEGATYGYFGGGATPTLINTITRLDFSNETISNPGNNLPTAVQDSAATSSSSYGYFGGGDTSPSLINTITRLDFSNETISNPGNNLPTVRLLLAATSSNSYGYFGGGDTGVSICTITRLDFSNETVSDPGKNLSAVRNRLAATSNSSYGYFGGGGDGLTPGSTISRLDFSNETLSNPKNLPSARRDLKATSSSSYGYFCGGLTSTTPPEIDISIITRLDFSNETVSNTTNLPSERSRVAALSGGQSILRRKGFKTYGYFAGGTDPLSTPNITSQISRLDFSTEVTSVSNALPETMRRMASNIASNNYGYFAHGTTNLGNPGVVIHRLDFINDLTISLLDLPPGSASTDGGGLSSNSYGYFGGGNAPPSPSTVINLITRFDFSTETTNIPNKNLANARSSIAAISSNSYGYFGGGNGDGSVPSAELSYVSRLDFSNEVVTNITPLPAARQDFSAGSNFLYGYFFGGQIPGAPPPGSAPNNTSTIIRLDFSNDTMSAISPRLPNAKENHATVSANSYSYTGGGNIGLGTLISTITRFNFSTETASNISNTLPQSSGVENLASVTNSN
jgi:hypothetical protein